MQHNPVQRTVRFIILSIGFVLFVLLAFRSAAHVSDPRFLRGKPFLFARTHSPQLVGEASAAGDTQVVATAQSAPTEQPETAPSASTSQAKSQANAHENSASVTSAANSQIVPGQIKKTAAQVQAHSKD